MSNGTVVILGRVSRNVGSGMTGGVLFLRKSQAHQVNDEYIAPAAPDEKSFRQLNILLTDYEKKTGSQTAAAILADWQNQKDSFLMLVPKGVLSIDEQNTRKKKSAVVENNQI